MTGREAILGPGQTEEPAQEPTEIPATPIQKDPQEGLRALFVSGSARDKLMVVEHAIFEIMFGAQSYQIGTHKLTRADLKQLNALRAEFQRAAAAEEGNSVTIGVARGAFNGFSR